MTAAPDARVAGHEYALRALSFAADGQTIFVPGVGTIADRATVTGGALLVETEPHPIAVVSSRGPVIVDALSEEALPPGEPPRVSVLGPSGAPDGGHLAELDFVLAESEMVVWRDLAELTGVPTVTVSGRVTGTGERAEVVGRDGQGNPQVDARTAEGGSFTLDVPTSGCRVVCPCARL